MTAPRSDLRQSVTAATARIQEIIDAAERVANEIEAEARAKAESYREEKRREADELVEARIASLSETSDGLVSRVERVRALTDELAAELEAAIAGAREVAHERVPAPTVVPAPPPPPQPEARPGPAPVAYPGRGMSVPPPSAEKGQVADDHAEEALLRATQLAVSGSSRSEIESTLRSEFGLADPAEVVDEILGGAEAG
jgi:hypothetical protein